MGDMADYYRSFDQEAEQHFQELESDRIRDEYASGRLEWTTKNDDPIEVKLMGNKHIHNIIKMLNRNINPSEVTLAWIEVFEKEIVKRQKQREL